MVKVPVGYKHSGLITSLESVPIIDRLDQIKGRAVDDRITHGPHPSSLCRRTHGGS